MLKKPFKLLALALCVLMALSVAAGCSNNKSNNASKKVTLSVFSDLPDRTTGQGLIEQQLINSYEKVNPNMTIKVEALQDDPYKQKFKAYVTANNLPDLFMVWGQPSFFQSVMEQGYAAQLNPSDYTSYDFLKGSLDGFSLNGKLYGLPRNSDFMALYYNSKIFSANNLQPPTSFSDFASMAATLKSKGISLLSIGGGEKWPLAILYNDIVLKETGSDKVIRDAFTKSDFGDPTLLKAATDFQNLAQTSNVLQASFATDQTGDAQNLFAQGKSAMYYSGEWDMSMATNTSFSSDFTSSLKVAAFPVIPGGSGKVTDIMAWNGGGYAVSAHSPNKDAATKLLNYIMKPENWTEQGWKSGQVVPAQQFNSFLTGKENTVQTGLVNILTGATSMSGTTVNDSSSAQFKTDFETAVQELATKQLTPAKFIATVTASVKANPVT
jgi:raffinose/stachyose/melibiose transport system substrate-binding protein